MDQVDTTENPVTPSVAALVVHGRALHQQGDLTAARQLYDQALLLDPQDAQAHFLLSVLALSARDHTHAQDHLRKACEFNPQDGACAYLLGHVLHEAGQPDEALQACDRALLLAPGALQAHLLRGNLLITMRRHADALRSYDHVLEINPAHPDGLYNRAQALIRIAEDAGDDDLLLPALHSLRQLLAIRPQAAEVHRLCGSLLKAHGKLDEAIACYEEAIRHDPSSAVAHYALSTCWLLQGHWQRAWEKFEFRRHFGPALNSPSAPGQRRWQGEPLAGKSILLVAEGGLGDTLNFVRYARLVATMARSVSVAVQPELRSLLKRGSSDAVKSGDGTDQCYDYYCYFMSLPGIFHTRPNTVPFADGYVHADPAKTAQWRQRLASPRKMRVGLAWSGNPEHLNDYNRSMPLSALASLLDEPDVDFCCLQQAVRDTDREALDALAQLAFFGDDLQDFDDTAALCNAMDLVITVDTSVAHLAGAMGKPVWIMLPVAAEYRWMTGREDTPWYSSARLFRQNRFGDWPDVVARVRSQLRLLLVPTESPGPGAPPAAPAPR